jgi:hypothetical protein
MFSAGKTLIRHENTADLVLRPQLRVYETLWEVVFRVNEAFTKPNAKPLFDLSWADISQIAIHKPDQPNIVVNFFLPTA